MSLIPKYECHRCGAEMATVFFMDGKGDEICQACFDAKPVPCEHCPEPTPPDDRVPTAAGGFCHAACGMRVSNALANQRAHLLGARGLVVMKGGRS